MEKLNKNFDLIKAIKKTNNQILKQESELVRKYNLSTSQYGVLECLYLKGDMCINKLIEKLISTSGTMTVIVKNLEKMQLVSRKSNDNDKRSFNIILTSKGRNLVEQILPERIEQLDEFASIFTAEEKENILRLLYKVKEKYEVNNYE